MPDSPAARGLIVAFALLLAAPGAAVAQPPARPDVLVPVFPASATEPAPLPAVEPKVDPAPATDPKPAADPALQGKWKNGLRFESADKNFSVFVGGRAQFDVANYAAPLGLRQNVPGTNPLEDGVSFRRIRLDMGGTIYKNIEFYTQVDFANGLLLSSNNRTPGGVSNATYPTDVWVQFKDLPWVGNIRVGNQKPLYSFEHLTSSRFLNFLERSIGFDAFAEGFDNGFEPGITVFDTYLEKRGTWGVGVFKTTRNPFGWNVGRNETEVNGRVTCLLADEDDGRFLVHLGVGAADRDTDDGQARARARLDVRNSPSSLSPLVADTGAFGATRQQILVPEFVFVCGPLSFQSEYYATWVRGVDTGTADRPAPQGTVFLQSVYAEAHYFLTGEHREYNREAGTFTRVAPRSPLAWTRSGFTGLGAWQLAARYAYLDLNDKGVQGGRVNDLTLGLNWFLNPNMKVQWNYSLAHRDAPGTAGDGYINAFGTRVAIDF